MSNKLYKRALSWIMTVVMLLSLAMLPVSAESKIAANEMVTVELTGYAGYGTSTSTGKHYAFSTAAASKTALAATSWFAGASPSTNYGSFTTLTGNILVDGVEEEATLRFNGSGSALYIEKSQTHLEAGKTIVVPKENVFTVTKSNGGTIANGGQIQFAKTYALTYDATNQKPVVSERVIVELMGYAFNTETSTGKHYAFTPSDATKTELAATTWFAGATASTNYGSFTTMKGKILVDGVEEEATLRFNKSGSGLYIEKSQTYLEAGKVIVLPKANAFTVTHSNGGTITGNAQIQFAKTYVFTYDATNQKPVMSESVTVELAGYAFNTETSTGKHYAFTPSNATLTELAATTWFAGATASTSYGSFTTMTGKILVDGVEEEATLRFNKSGSGLYIEKSQTYLEAGKEIILPKANAFTVTKSNGGTIAGTAQIQFAETYKLTYDAATQKPVLEVVVEIAAKEKVAVELDAYAWMSQSSVENGYGFSMSAATKTALTGTSWFGNTSGGNYGAWTRATGKVLVDGVETEVNVVFQASQSAVYIGNTVAYLTAGKTVVIPEDSVFTVNRTYGGTLDNGGQIQFAKTYKLTYDAATQKPKLEVVVEVAAKEKVAVELESYAWMSQSSVENGYGFSMTAATKTALTGTSWFGNTSGGNYGAWTRATGKVLVDGVETEVNVVFQASQSAVYIGNTVAYLTAGKTVVIPKDNVFTVNRTYGGTLENGGQIQFANTYKLTYDAATQKPVLGLDPKDCTHAWDAATGTCTLCKTACAHTSVTNNKCDTCGYIAYTVQDMQVAFDQVSSSNNWSFTFSTDTMPQTKAYFKGTALVDGQAKTVYFHYYEVGKAAFVIYPQCFSGSVLPTNSFKLEKDTELEAWTAPNGTKLQGVPNYRISETLEVKKDGGVWLDSRTAVQDMQMAFDQVSSSNNWSFTFSTDTMPQTKAYFKATAIVDGEAKTVFFHYYEAGKAAFIIYPQCFSGSVLPVNSFKLEKDTVLEAWTAPNGSKMQGVPNYRISETLGVKKDGGVWLDSRTPVEDMQVAFGQVSNNNWSFTFSTDTMPQTKAYFKATAIVDGEAKTVFFHYYEAGKAAFIIYPQCFSGSVLPVNSFKLEKDTVLEAWTAPNGSKVQGVPNYRISETLEVKKTSGVWLDSNTPICEVQIFYDHVDATRDYWYFSAKGDHLPEKSVYLQGQALVDGVMQTVFFHYTGPDGVYIYSQCFTKGVPTESFQLVPGTLLVPCTTPNSGRIPGATVLLVTNETTANKAEGILWVGTSKERPEQKLVDPLKATVEYAGNTQNMLWLRVTTNEGKKLKEIYGNRQTLKGKMLVGLLNKEEGVTEYTLENVSFQVLEGSLYVSVPGLNALEMVYISAGTVLTPTDSALSDRSLVLKNDFRLERNKRDKWELRSKAVDTPQTGDSFNPELLIALMVLSLVGMTVTLVFYRKKKVSF